MTDQAWKIGMGSLSGYELGRAPYLQTIFYARSKHRQISLIRDVIGMGPMSGDRYRINGKDLLNPVLRFLNDHMMYKSVSRSRFKKGLESCTWRITHHSSQEQRFHCFQKALMMRSVRTCSTCILFKDSFNLDEEEWAAWEDSALRVGRERPHCDHE
jgi:hypothetical protein